MQPLVLQTVSTHTAVNSTTGCRCKGLNPFSPNALQKQMDGLIQGGSISCNRVVRWHIQNLGVPLKLNWLKTEPITPKQTSQLDTILTGHFSVNLTKHNMIHTTTTNTQPMWQTVYMVRWWLNQLNVKDKKQKRSFDGDHRLLYAISLSIFSGKVLLTLFIPKHSCLKVIWV